MGEGRTRAATGAHLSVAINNLQHVLKDVCGDVRRHPNRPASTSRNAPLGYRRARALEHRRVSTHPIVECLRNDTRDPPASNCCKARWNMILRTLLFGPRPGHSIAKHIKRTSEDILQVETGRYPALHRLEARGWIEASWEQSDRGKRAKYCRLTVEDVRSWRQPGASGTCLPARWAWS